MVQLRLRKRGLAGNSGAHAGIKTHRQKHAAVPMKPSALDARADHIRGAEAPLEVSRRNLPSLRKLVKAL